MRNRKLKKISRRKFNGGLAATSVAAPTMIAPQTAEANQEGGAAELVAGLVGLLLISRGGRGIAVKQIILLFAVGAILISLSPRQKLKPIANLPKGQQPNSLLPLTRLVGTAFLLNTTIFVLMTGGLPGFRNLNMLMYPTGPNGEKLSAQKGFRPKPKKLKNMPSAATVKSKGRRVGTLRANAKNRNTVLEIKNLRAQF